MAKESAGRYVPRIRIEKYENGSEAPFEVVEREGNLTTLAGRDYLAGLLVGSRQPFDDEHIRIAVGTGDSVADEADTIDDIGSANSSSRHLQLPDSVTNSGTSVEIVATFGSGVANFDWESWGLDLTEEPGADDGVVAGDLLFNRKAESLGTKNSFQTWVFTATLDF